MIHLSIRLSDRQQCEVQRSGSELSSAEYG
jgi:hypothetical protein